MKGILLIIGALALAVLPVRAGVHVSVNIGGGGYHCSGGSYSRGCGYSANCYRGGYNGYCNYNWGWGWGGGYAVAYPYSYYPGGYYDNSAYMPTSYSPYPNQPTAPQPAPAMTAAPVAPPAPILSPVQEPLGTGILDINGFIHSPYSNATFKVPDVRNGQMVYDPVTGKPFLVH